MTVSNIGTLRMRDADVESTQAAKSPVATQAVDGDWFMKLAEIEIKAADNKMQRALDAADNQSKTEDAFNLAEKAFSKFPDGMDHRKDGDKVKNNGDVSNDADNGKNVADAKEFNSEIQAAIDALPADSPYREKLKGFLIDPSKLNGSFILTKDAWAEMKSSFETAQKSLQSAGSMKLFFAQQAVSDQSKIVEMLSSVQQSMNRTMEDLAKHVGG